MSAFHLHFSSWVRALFAPSFRTNFRKLTSDLKTLKHDAQHRPKAAGGFQKLMARLDNIDECLTKEAAAYKVKLIARRARTHKAPLNQGP
ncbi:hypothetical protein Q9L58_007875 [Maublancomyces gigas]|uniref:Uncharacterized protein n=1 Tax=Discina gigas TaxID=1032678 RepID=A0ABR3GBD2_9PEZI